MTEIVADVMTRDPAATPNLEQGPRPTSTH
jgi:hypothetical protein